MPHKKAHLFLGGEATMDIKDIAKYMLGAGEHSHFYVIELSCAPEHLGLTSIAVLSDDPERVEDAINYAHKVMVNDT